LYPNATAIAGITPTPEVNQSAIVLGADGRALCNMFSISQYYDDYDSSAYPDNFELWMNEIAYMMRPTIDSPGDLVFELDEDPTEFTWTPYSYAPGDYQIKRDSIIIETHVWDGSAISVDISTLPLDVYVFELMVRDHVGYRTDDMIVVTIQDTIAPEWVDAPTDIDLFVGDVLNVQLSAEDASGIGGWSVDDTIHFAISSSGLLTNNTILTVGTYIFSVSVEDTEGNTRQASMTVEVTLGTTPPPPGDFTMILIIAGTAGVVVVIVLIFLMKKKKT
jgi:hypothetical protein